MDWLKANCQSILLVGEANFSFAVILAQHLQTNVHITATSFEAEPDVERRLKGGNNLALLRQLGAKLLFQVDATKLHLTEPIQHSQYDAIIFNFPHVGRKAGINKNRQLLKQFFESSHYLLTPTGRVMVSLCNGQGGTPVDTPQREWNNSWQVVAMATYGGFILRAAIPFTSAFPVEYCNTGYRSQNKKFLNESAVTHVFEQGPPWSPPTGNVDPVIIATDGGVLHTCPADLCAFKTRKLLRETNHPLYKMASHITTAFKTQIPNLCEKDIPEIVLEKHSQCQNEIHVEVKGHACHGEDQDSVSVSEVKGHCPDKTSECNVNCYDINVLHDVAVDSMLDEGSSDGKSEDNVKSGRQAVCNLHGRPAVNILVSSLLQHTGVILQGKKPQCPVIMTSDVHHMCPIDKNIKVLPIMHQMLVILPHSEEALWDSFEDVVFRILKSVMNSGIENVEELFDVDVVHGLNKSKIPELDSDTHHDYSLNQHLLCALPESVKISDVSSIINARACVQYIGVCGKLNFDPKTAKFILINLDCLVMCKFNVDDIRLLWSEDPQQWEHMHYKQNVSRDSQTTCIERISKFPPSYIHDLSFWAPITDRQFDQFSLVSVVRKIAGLFIEELNLLDLYKNDKSGRVGLCYRLVYRSIDKALSKDQARLIQGVVRESVRRELSVDLR